MMRRYKDAVWFKIRGGRVLEAVDYLVGLGCECCPAEIWLWDSHKNGFKISLLKNVKPYTKGARELAKITRNGHK